VPPIQLKSSIDKLFLRIHCYFRAHMEYKRPDVGLKINREALHFLHHIFFIKRNSLTICEGYMVCLKCTTRGINPALGTANTRPLKD